MLDPDAIDFDSPAYQEHTKTLTAQGIEGKLHPYRFLRAHAQRAISGHKIILWNQPFSLAGGFQRTIENLRAYAVDRNIRLPILTVEVAIDPIIAQARIADRKEQGGHGPSDERFERFVNEYVSFADMGQDHTITVQGDGDVTVAVAAVLAALRALEQPQV